jgi:hypothetical protein
MGGPSPALAHADARPVEGSRTGISVLTNPATCDPLRGKFICDYELSGALVVTHLVSGTYRGHATSNFATSTAAHPCAAVSGFDDPLAANGDVVHITISGTMSDTSPPSSLHLVNLTLMVAGGTDRFATATRTVTSTGTSTATAIPTVGIANAILSGTIGYSRIRQVVGRRALGTVERQRIANAASITALKVVLAPAAASR